MLRQGLDQLKVPLAVIARQPLDVFAVRHTRARRGRRQHRRSERTLDLRADSLAEEVERRPCDDGHASANEPDVAFDAGPYRDFVVMPGGIGHVAEGGEVAEPHDTAGGDEEADEEDEDDSGFAPGAFDLEADEFGDGEEEDDEVEEDVEAAVYVYHGQKSDWTVALVLAIPLKPEVVLKIKVSETAGQGFSVTRLTIGLHMTVNRMTKAKK
jgi:hypothetical protein